MLWIVVESATGAFAFAYVPPIVVANAVVMSFISTNHGLCSATAVNDPLIGSRSVTTPRWIAAMDRRDGSPRWIAAMDRRSGGAWSTFAPPERLHEEIGSRPGHRRALDPCLHAPSSEPVRTEDDLPSATSTGGRPLAAITILLIGLLVYVLLPVLAALVVGGFCVLVVQRPFEWLVVSLGGRRTVATWIMTLGTLILLFVPIGLLLYATVLQAIEASQWLAGRVSDLGGIEGIAARLPGPLGGGLRWLRDRGVLDGSGDGGQIAGYATQIASSIASSTGGFLAQSFFAMVTIYYLLLRGPSFVRFLRLASPLRPAQTDAFAREFRHVALGLFWGNVVTAVFHGVASAIGYAIFGVPNILLLGALTALASFVPVIGTATVWIPIVAVLAITGSTWSAIGLLVYSIVVVGGVDNVLRPLVSKGHMALPNLLVFLTLFGGLQVWGMKGLILGPLAGSLAITALRLRVEARAVAHTTPRRFLHGSLGARPDRAAGSRGWASFRWR